MPRYFFSFPRLRFPAVVWQGSPACGPPFSGQELIYGVPLQRAVEGLVDQHRCLCLGLATVDGPETWVQ